MVRAGGVTRYMKTALGSPPEGCRKFASSQVGLRADQPASKARAAPVWTWPGRSPAPSLEGLQPRLDSGQFGARSGHQPRHGSRCVGEPVRVTHSRPTGQLIATIGGRSAASMSWTTSRSEPLIVSAARSVRLCIGISLSRSGIPGPSGDSKSCRAAQLTHRCQRGVLIDLGVTSVLLTRCYATGQFGVRWSRVAACGGATSQA
jgi:hypothetical protein